MRSANWYKKNENMELQSQGNPLPTYDIFCTFVFFFSNNMYNVADYLGELTNFTLPFINVQYLNIKGIYIMLL